MTRNGSGFTLIDALADAAGDEVIERVSPAPRFAGAAVVERLLVQLERLEEPLELVIDDLHELDSDDALAWLEMLLTRLPRTAAGRARDARGAGARPAPPAARGRADRTARARPALLARRNARPAPCQRDHSVGYRSRLAARTHRGMAGRFAPGGDLADRAPGPGTLRVRVLRQRADRGGLPPRRGAGAPAAGGARPALAHVDPRARQRPAGRCAHRRARGPRRSSSGSKTRTPSSPRSTPPVPGSATTTCSPICCASSCGASRRRRSRRCTAPRPPGTKRRATSSKPSATIRQPVTGHRLGACSWTTTSR